MTFATIFTLAASLALTVAIAGMALVGGFVAAMPDGTVAHGVTPRLRVELYASSAACLYAMGRVWLSVAS